MVGPGLLHHVRENEYSVTSPDPFTEPHDGFVAAIAPIAPIAPAWKRTTWWLVVRSLRPRQWIKNLLVFMAPAAAGVLGHWATTFRVVAAFFVFCAVASGTYLINDVVDAESDRHHPVKRRRPVASGDLSTNLALGIGVVLMALGIAAALVIGPWGFGMVVRRLRRPQRRLQPAAEERARRRTGDRRGGVRAPCRGGRSGGRRAPLQLVPRLHLVRRARSSSPGSGMRSTTGSGEYRGSHRQVLDE